MRVRMLRNAALISLGCFVMAASAYSQVRQDERLAGSDSHETGQGPHGHFLGDWDGMRSRLSERGVTFDFQYVSDSLADVGGDKADSFAMWNRARATVDVDFGCAGRCTRFVVPCESAMAGWRQFRRVSRLAYQPERYVEHEYVPPRFVVDREAMARRAPDHMNRTICRARFLWGATLRCFTHF